MDLADLRRIVRDGEGSQLEFKRKANHPHKLAREAVAFANSEGGLLMVGVDDDGHIYGCKYPEEDAFALEQFFAARIRPRLAYSLQKIQVTAQRQVLVYQIKTSRRKPVYLLPTAPHTHKQAFVRVRDMSIRASREMEQLLRYKGSRKGAIIRFGEAERTLLQHLETHTRLTLEGAYQLLQLSPQSTSQKLVLLTRAGLLNIHPTAQGDYYTLSPNAFE